jgi:hypothetical protein
MYYSRHSDRIVFRVSGFESRVSSWNSELDLYCDRDPRS